MDARRRSIFAAAVLFASIGASVGPPLAQACTYIYQVSLFTDPPPAYIELSWEGVMVLGVSESSVPGSPTPGITITVRDTEGLDVVGNVERVDIFEGRFLLVWRAASPVNPDADYAVMVESEYLLGPVTLIASVADAPHPGPWVPAEPEIEVRRVNVPQQSCEPTPLDTCGTLDCTVTHEIQEVQLRWNGGESDRSVIYQLVREDVDVAARSAFGWNATPADAAHTPVVGIWQQERGERYCAYIEATSLIDGTVVRSNDVCVDDESVPEIDPPLESAGCTAGNATFDSSPIPAFFIVTLLLVLRRRSG